ncbi:toll-like receptor 4 [Magallana gigas]|nr:toll-like receptor 4 [Crassostrea gigas]|eukprot:XP_011440734.1 PREDICTED: toll-like receptor 4 [Crassostrea gigas]
MAHCIQYFIIFFCFDEFARGRSCCNEQKCVCAQLEHFKELYHMDCSNRGLTEIPIPSKDTEVYSIDLSRNELRNVTITNHFSRTLKQLNLSHNELSILSNNSFNWIPYLEVLDLSYNILRLSNTSLPNLVFQYLSNLKVLNLSHNDVIGTDHYNAEIFRHTESLETLVIDGLRNGNFDFKTKNKRCAPSYVTNHDTIELTKLTTLIVSGRRNRSKCLVTDLSAGFFDSVSNITYLDMSGCAIQSIGRESLSPLSHLTYLDVSYNEQLSFHSIRNISTLKGLKTLKLDKIHCTFGRGIYITEDMVHALRDTSIENISLKSNRIEMAARSVYYYLPPNLTNADISDNRLTFGAYVLTAYAFRNLKFANLSGQSSSHFTGKTDDFMICKHATVCSSLSTQHTHPVLNREISLFRSKEGVKLYLPPHLETIDISSSSLSSNIHVLYIDPNNNLKTINFSHNFFQHLGGPVYGLQKIETCDFSNNFISYLSPDFFIYCTTLKYINFKGNLLGNSMSKSNATYFVHLRNLTFLDLSSNVIRFVSPDIFEGLESLKTLNLSFNLLRNFSFRTHQMPFLRTLDLSFNELLPFSDFTIKFLESRQRLQSLKIILTGNVIPCTCDSLDFFKWMLSHEKTVEVDYSYICQNMHSVENSNDLELIRKILMKKCDDYDEIIGVVSALFVVFFAFIVSGIIHRYRWKLRYIYYMSIWSTTTSHKSYGKVYDYDAFVSYADEENDFVIQEMTPELEEVSDLRLCLHERDFTPGISIGENITKAICNSRKVLCVVTENFLCSQWCMYELEMALTDNRYSRDDQSVFLIMYGGLPTDSCKIRSSIRLMSLVKEHAYLEYPNDESNRAEFWNSLRLIAGKKP